MSSSGYSLPYVLNLSVLFLPKAIFFSFQLILQSCILYYLLSEITSKASSSLNPQAGINAKMTVRCEKNANTVLGKKHPGIANTSRNFSDHALYKLLTSNIG